MKARLKVLLLLTALVILAVAFFSLRSSKVFIPWSFFVSAGIGIATIVFAKGMNSIKSDVRWLLCDRGSYFLMGFFLWYSLEGNSGIGSAILIPLLMSLINARRAWNRRIESKLASPGPIQWELPANPR